MTPRQIAEQASTIRTGFGTRRDFDEPTELVFSEDDALPDEEVCPNCDAPMMDGECENCTPPTGIEQDDDDCTDCNGTGEMAFGHRCDHGRTRLHISRPYRRLDPDEI